MNWQSKLLLIVLLPTAVLFLAYAIAKTLEFCGHGETWYEDDEPPCIQITSRQSLHSDDSVLKEVQDEA